MKRVIFAPYIFDGISDKPHTNTCVLVDESGLVKGFVDKNTINPTEIYDGIIVPGLFNSHCHLEHSGMNIEKVEDLTDFIYQLRYYTADENWNYSKNDIAQVDKMMAKEGIVFCADISNSVSTIEQKIESEINYHTFLELFGVNKKESRKFFLDGLEKKKLFNLKNLFSSLTPHSFYSLSDELMILLLDYIVDNENFMSVHFMESYKELHPKQISHDISNRLNNKQIVSKENIETISECLARLLSKNPYRGKVLFIHAIYIDVKMLELLDKLLINSWFCICPTSNLFIEKRMISANILEKHIKRVVLGTDGQASNSLMSIVQEMFLFQDYYKLPFWKVLNCVTKNPSQFFEQHNLGKIEIDKKSTLVHISNFDFHNEALTKWSRGEKI